MTKERPKVDARHRVHHFFAELGPGLITGAADDDPSGISTYSVTGAAFGFGQLWTPLFAFPLVAAVQLMCARLGLVTGRGLAGVIRRRYSPWVLWLAATLLVVANTVNIGADLGGMAAAMQMVTGVTAAFWLPFFGAGIVALLFLTSYRQIVRVFKWLTLVLFAYVLTAFLARPNWGQVLLATVLPRVVLSPGYLATFLGVLGTTITPYLFFWQAAQEVEVEREMGRRTPRQRAGATDDELHAARTDVVTGMACATLVMYFIILTTGSTLYASGQRDIQTAQQAAEALRPLAGQGAYLLFTLGLVGTGMLGVPVLAGSGAYAVAEAMHWRGSLNDPPHVAPKFYAVLAAGVILGLAIDMLRLNAVRMLFWSAVLNGALAPPLVAIITLLTSDRKVMGERVSPPLLRGLGWFTCSLMAGATVAMVWSWLR